MNDNNFSFVIVVGFFAIIVLFYNNSIVDYEYPDFIYYHRELVVVKNHENRTSYIIRPLYDIEGIYAKTIPSFLMELILYDAITAGGCVYFNCSDEELPHKFEKLIPVRHDDQCYYVPIFVSALKTNDRIVTFEETVYPEIMSAQDIMPYTTQTIFEIEKKEQEDGWILRYSIEVLAFCNRQNKTLKSEVYASELHEPSLAHLLSYVGNHEVMYSPENLGIDGMIELQSYYDEQDKKMYPKITRDFYNLFFKE